ncbi:MAG: DUF87 domain-containing protein [Haloarculaceae archaeon]
MHVVGRRERGGRDGSGSTGPAGRLGWFRARDGSHGAPVGVDLDRPHAGLVVGKRGSGKSYTLGVLAEELAATEGVVPVVLDPLDAFVGLEECGFHTRKPRVRATALAPRAWCELLGLGPTAPAGSLVWRAASERDSLEGMRSFVGDADVTASTARAARNHLDLAASWGVFGESGVDPSALAVRPTRLSLSGLDPAPANAVVRAVLAGCHRARLGGEFDRLPWLLVDEARAFVGGIAEPAVRRVLTRGRAPGTSLVLATQRPSALPEVAASQADVVIAHRLSGRADREALERVRPAAARVEPDRRPTGPGDALLFDGAGESVHAVRVRERETPHGGTSPRAGERAGSGGGQPTSNGHGESVEPTTGAAGECDRSTGTEAAHGEPTPPGTWEETRGT